MCASILKEVLPLLLRHQFQFTAVKNKRYDDFFFVLKMAAQQFDDANGRIGKGFSGLFQSILIRSLGLEQPVRHLDHFMNLCIDDLMVGFKELNPFHQTFLGFHEFWEKQVILDPVVMIEGAEKLLQTWCHGRTKFLWTHFPFTIPIALRQKVAAHHPEMPVNRQPEAGVISHFGMRHPTVFGIILQQKAPLFG